MLLSKKVVLITGGTSGIGKATVHTCLREWAIVFFTGRNDQNGQKLLQECGNNENLFFIKNDVTNVAWLENVVKTIIQQCGTIDGVFANAWRHMVGTIEDTTLEQRRNMFAVDVEGVFLTLKYCLPHMKKQGGSIVIMWSDQCLIGKGESAAYGAAKGAVGQLTKSAAIDYAQYNIRINAVCPWTIDTPLARGAMKGFADKNFDGDFDQWYAFLEKAQPIQRLGKSEEVAELVTFMLSDKAGFMTGSLVSIDGGYVAG